MGLPNPSPRPIYPAPANDDSPQYHERRLHRIALYEQQIEQRHRTRPTIATASMPEL